MHLIWRGERQSHRWPPAWAQRTAAQIKNCTQGYLISVVLNFFDKPLLSTEREAEGLVLAGGPSKVLNSASFPHTWCLSRPMQRISTINTDPWYHQDQPFTESIVEDECPSSSSYTCAPSPASSYYPGTVLSPLALLGTASEPTGGDNCQPSILASSDPSFCNVSWWEHIPTYLALISLKWTKFQI